MSAMASIYKIFNPYLLQNSQSDQADISSEVLGRQGNFELLNSFCSDFQAGRHGGNVSNDISSNDISSLGASTEYPYGAYFHLRYLNVKILKKNDMTNADLWYMMVR